MKLLSSSAPAPAIVSMSQFKNKSKGFAIIQMQMHQPPHNFKAGGMMVFTFFPITNKLKDIYLTF